MTWKIRPNRPEDAMQLAEIYLSVRRRTFTWVDPGKFHREDFAAHTTSRGAAMRSSPISSISNSPFP